MYVAKQVLCMMYNINQSFTDNVWIIVQNDQTPLHKAACNNQLEIVEFFIIKGAELDIGDRVSAS